MGVVGLKKVVIALPSREKDRIIKYLQDYGKLHIDHITEHTTDITSPEPEISKDLERLLSEIKGAVNFLKRYTDTKINFVQSFFEFKYFIDEDFINNLDSYMDDLRNAIKEARKIERTIEELKKELKEMKLFYSDVKTLAEVAVFKLGDLDPTGKTKAVIGMMGKKAWKRLITDNWDDIDKKLWPVCYLLGSNQKGNAVFVRYFKTQESMVLTKLMQYKFHPFTIPEDIITKYISKEEYRKLDIQTFKKKVEELIGNLESNLNAAEMKANLLAKNYFVKLLAAHDEIIEQIRRQEIDTYMGKTNSTVIIVGWLKKDDMDELRTELNRRFPTTTLLFQDPSKDDDPPTALENNSIVKPFEIITSMYSMPLYKELDPTPYLTPFFLLFFPLCLGDAGYGIMLLIICLLVMKNVQMGYDGKRLLMILILCSLMTIIIGALMGSWFGLPKEYLPQILRDITLLDPLEPRGAMMLLLICFIIGIVQSIYVGYSVDIYRRIKMGDIKGVFAEDITSMLFLTFLILFVLAYFGIRPYVEYYNTMLQGLIISAIILFVGMASTGEGLIGKLGAGVWGLYSVGVGAISDILSYSRLLALGLVTSAIGLVFNTMALMIKDAIPVIGVIVMLFVMLVAGVFNVIISSLGGFVHTMRLQYVEFFSKFYSGGGREFRPFRKEYKNVHVIRRPFREI